MQSRLFALVGLYSGSGLEKGSDQRIKPERERKRGNRRGGWLAWPIDQHWRFLRHPYVIVGLAVNMPWHREPSLGPVHS